LFLLAAFLTLLIAMATVLLQALKAANMNPSEALRYE
jgi:ABC-type antimicrobial peptide transport system permease subunit